MKTESQLILLCRLLLDCCRVTGSRKQAPSNCDLICLITKEGKGKSMAHLLYTKTNYLLDTLSFKFSLTKLLQKDTCIGK